MVTTVLMVPTLSGFSNLSFGLKGGAGFSRLGFSEPPGDEWNNLMSFRLGGEIKLRVSRWIYLQIECFYVRKGGQAYGTLRDEEIRLNENLDYLEFPMLLNIHIPITPETHGEVYTGVYAAYNVRAKTVAEYRNEKISDDIKAQIRPCDTGLVFGGGITFRKFLFEARYVFGLRAIGNNPDESGFSGFSVKNRDISIMLGYRF